MYELASQYVCIHCVVLIINVCINVYMYIYIYIYMYYTFIYMSWATRVNGGDARTYAYARSAINGAMNASAMARGHGASIRKEPKWLYRSSPSI